MQKTTAFDQFQESVKTRCIREPKGGKLNFENI